VVGFLNYHEGGEIYIGIDDNGKIFGVEDSDDMQKRIVDRIKNNIYPSTMGLFDVVAVKMDCKDIVKSYRVDQKNLIISKNTECLPMDAF